MDQMMVWALPPGAFVITVLLGLILRGIVFRRLAAWAKNSTTKVDDIVIAGIRSPSIIWILMLALYFTVQVSAVSGNTASLMEKILFVLGVISVTLALADISSRVVKTYADRIESALPMTSLTQNITRLAVLGIGLLMILNSLGVSITPVLASLGIGGLAVALGLQETLSNLFAGFHIIISKQIRVGDYIKVDSGEEGYVIDINWRTTQIKALPNNVVLVPNSKLNQAIVVNYYMPDKEIAVLMRVGVHYNSDLQKVEQITSEVGKEIMKTVPGGVPEFNPFIRYDTFGDFSINFTVILRGKEFVDQHLIRHEFIKALHERYAKEGIIIPYPTQTVHYDYETSKSLPPQQGGEYGRAQ